MQTEFWNILIVDDEPDVLRMSELAMRDFTVYDLPIKLHLAKSKAEAIELLSTKLTRNALNMPYTAVAFIDVVMESDTAGLELCQHIRGTMGNQLTQLYIRTGQPGVAPEREVMDRYDINGYFTKAEATEDKLYSLVKSGVRQFFTIQTSIGTNYAADYLAAVSDSRANMEQALRQGLEAASQDAEGNDLIGLKRAEFYMLGDIFVGNGLDEATAHKLRTRLDQLSGVSIGAEGDKYVVDDDKNVMIKIAGGPARTELIHVHQSLMDYPDFHFRLAHAFLSTISRLWHRAQ